jgi:hypothetical protein
MKLIKQTIISLLISLFVSFLIIISVGIVNQNIGSNCRNNYSHVSLNYNLNKIYNDKDLKNIKKMVIDNKLLFVGLNYNSTKEDYLKLFNLKNAETSYKSCINYFSKYNHDYLNWLNNLSFKEEEINFDNIYLFELYHHNINQEMIIGLLDKYDLSNKFNLEDNSLLNENITDYTFYNFFFIDSFLILFSVIIYDIYRIIKNSKEYRILSNFGYDDLTITKNLILSKRSKQLLSILILTLIILLLYYQNILPLYGALIVVFILLYLLSIVFGIVVTKVVRIFLRKNYNYLLIIIIFVLFLITNIFSIYLIKNNYSIFELNNMIKPAQDKNNYYQIDLYPLQLSNEQHDEINNHLVKEYNGFGIYSSNNDTYEYYESTPNYLTNFKMYDDNHQLITFNNNECLIIISQDITNFNNYDKKCSLIKADISEKLNIFMSDSFKDYSSFVLDLRKRKSIQPAFKAKNLEDAKKIVKSIYNDMGINNKPLVKSANVFDEIGQSFLGNQMSSYFIIITMSLISLVIFNIVLIYLLFKYYLRLICLKNSYGYKLIKCLKEPLIILGCCYLGLGIYILLNLSIITIITYGLLVLMSVMIIYFSWYRNINKYLQADIREGTDYEHTIK